MQACCAALCYTGSHRPSHAYGSSMPRIIAHRGASGLAPENTLAAFDAAISVGADGIEFDVLLTADNVPVVHHDLQLSPDIARLNGDWIAGPGPAISKISAAELGAHDAGRFRTGSQAAARYPDYAPADGAHIPTLAEVLGLVNAKAPPGFELWIELKSDPLQPDISPDPAMQARLTVEQTIAAGLLESTTFVSFNWPTLQHVSASAPAARLGFNTDEQTRAYNLFAGAIGPSPWTGAPIALEDPSAIPTTIKSLGGAAWSAFREDLTPARIDAAHSAGLEVGAWTVRTELEKRAVLNLAPDVIITDRPDWAWR